MKPQQTASRRAIKRFIFDVVAIYVLFYSARRQQTLCTERCRLMFYTKEIPLPNCVSNCQ